MSENSDQKWVEKNCGKTLGGGFAIVLSGRALNTRPERGYFPWTCFGVELGRCDWLKANEMIVAPDRFAAQGLLKRIKHCEEVSGEEWRHDFRKKGVLHG